LLCLDLRQRNVAPSPKNFRPYCSKVVTYDHPNSFIGQEKSPQLRAFLMIYSGLFMKRLQTMLSYVIEQPSKTTLELKASC